MNPFLRVACLVALALVPAALPGCRSAGSTSDAAPAATGDWTLAWMHGEGQIAASRPPTLTIAPDGRVTGFAGINRLSAQLDPDRLRQREFAMSDAIVTRMGGPPEAMALETRFLALLDRADAFRVEGDIMVLTDPSGELLRFAREGPQPAEPGARETGRP